MPNQRGHAAIVRLPQQVKLQSVIISMGIRNAAMEVEMSETDANNFITRLSTMWDETLQDAPSWMTISSVTVSIR